MSKEKETLLRRLSEQNDYVRYAAKSLTEATIRIKEINDQLIKLEQEQIKK